MPAEARSEIDTRPMRNARSNGSGLLIFLVLFVFQIFFVSCIAFVVGFLQLFQNLENFAVGLWWLILCLFFTALRISVRRCCTSSSGCSASNSVKVLSSVNNLSRRRSRACMAAVSDLDAPFQLSIVFWINATSSSSRVRIFLPTYCI